MLDNNPVPMSALGVRRVLLLLPKDCPDAAERTDALRHTLTVYGGTSAVANTGDEWTANLHVHGGSFPAWNEWVLSGTRDDPSNPASYNFLVVDTDMLGRGNFDLVSKALTCANRPVLAHRWWRGVFAALPDRALAPVVGVERVPGGKYTNYGMVICGEPAITAS